MINPLNKLFLRSRMLKKRSCLLHNEVCEKSQAIIEPLLQHSVWQHAKNVLLYAACNKEPVLDTLMQEALAVGKHVYFPVCGAGETEKSEGRMDFFSVTHQSELFLGKYDILAPSGTTKKFCCQEESQNLSLALVPGVVFAKNGARIGYGKGYYDRYFGQQGCASIIRIGICYRFQLVEAMEQNEWDVPMQAIYTETGEIWL